MHRVVRRAAFALTAAAVLGVIAVIATAAVLYSHSNVWPNTRRLATALDGAQKVVLLEYVEGVELARKTATPEEVSRLRRSLPWLPHLFETAGALCFIPHHEITVQGGDGANTSFSICFSCENMMSSDGTGQESGYLYSSLPPSLRNPLASFFTSVGMPPKTDDEYAAILARRHNEAAAEGAPE
jgi:hypothetical protein